MRKKLDIVHLYGPVSNEIVPDVFCTKVRKWVAFASNVIVPLTFVALLKMPKSFRPLGGGVLSPGELTSQFASSLNTPPVEGPFQIVFVAIALAAFQQQQITLKIASLATDDRGDIRIAGAKSFCSYLPIISHPVKRRVLRYETADSNENGGQYIAVMKQLSINFSLILPSWCPRVRRRP